MTYEYLGYICSYFIIPLITSVSVSTVVLFLISVSYLLNTDKGIGETLTIGVLWSITIVNTYILYVVFTLIGGEI